MTLKALAACEAKSAPPAEEYARRLALRREAAGALARRERWLSHARLLVFLGAAVGAWFVFVRDSASALVLLPPALCFVVLVLLHDRTIRARKRTERAAALYERGLARLEDRWIGGGEAGERFLSGDHLYAADLDVFGRGSLFELLCTARTRVGEDTLAAWLCSPASPEEVRARQAAVAELAPLLDLREELALLGEEIQAGLAPDALARWAVAPPPSLHVGLRAACGDDPVECGAEHIHGHTAGVALGIRKPQQRLVHGPFAGQGGFAGDNEAGGLFDRLQESDA